MRQPSLTVLCNHRLGVIGFSYMKLLVYKSVKDAAHWFVAAGNTGHAFQDYSVLRSVERSVNRRAFITAFLSPFRFVRRIVLGVRKFRVYVGVVDDKPLFIMPLFRNDDKEWTVVGSSYNLDYTDAVWPDGSEDLCEHWVELRNAIYKDGIRRIVFRQLSEDSKLYKYCIPQQLEVRATSESVKIEFGGLDYNSYFLSLSKHARQNVRTAYNRLSRDGHCVSFAFYSVCGYGNELRTRDGICLLKKCRKMYKDRQRERYSHFGWRYLIELDWCNYTTLSIPGDIGFFAVVKIDGVEAAYMEGYVNRSLKSLEIPRLAMNGKFDFFSPGMILVNETVRWMIDHSDLRTLDLCRGTEKYKFDMGGNFYRTQTVSLTLDNRQ